MKQPLLLREIREQPDVLSKLIDRESANIRRIAGRRLRMVVACPVCYSGSVVGLSSDAGQGL